MKIHEDYGYEPLTVLPNGVGGSNGVLDLTASSTNTRIRWVRGVGGTCTVQGKERGYGVSEIRHYSTTGAFTGADAQSALVVGKEYVNWDKLYVASTSTAVQVGLVNSEEF